MLRFALCLGLLLSLVACKKPTNLNAASPLDDKVPGDPSKLAKILGGKSALTYSEQYPTFQGRQLDRVKMGTHSHLSGPWLLVKGSWRPMPDVEIFPKYYETSLMPVELQAGDMLYIPWGWSYWTFTESSISLNFYSKKAPHRFPGSSEGTVPSQISGGAWRHTDQTVWQDSDTERVYEHLKDLFEDRDDFDNANLPPQQQDEYTNIRCCGPQAQLYPEACVGPLSNLHLWVYGARKKAQRPWYGHGLHSYEEVKKRKEENKSNQCLVWSAVPESHWLRSDALVSLPAWIRKLKTTEYDVGFWYTAGKVDLGLQYNLYHNTIFNLRGNSTILLWAPEDAPKLYMSNQDWLKEERHKWEVYKQQTKAKAGENKKQKLDGKDLL